MPHEFKTLFEEEKANLIRLFLLLIIPVDS